MKRLSKLLIVALSLSLLVGCGDTKNNKSKNNESTKTEASEQTKNNEVKKEIEEEKDDSVGKTIKNELGTVTIVKSKKGINQTFETGPMKLTIKDIQIQHLDVNKNYKETFNNKDAVTVAIVNMEAENTSDDTVAFYPDQSTLVTNTKEQVEAALFLSDNVGGDFIGNVIKKGNVIFILDSPAEEINNLKFLIGGPVNAETFDSLGNDLTIEYDI